TVATDADQPIERQPLEARNHLARTILLAAVGHGKGERVAGMGPAEEGAPLPPQRRIEAIGVELDGFDGSLQQAERARAQPDCRPAVAMTSAQRHASEGGVQTRDTAA